MSGSPNRHTVPEVARLLGISERGVRDRIARGTLQAEREGTRWMVLLPTERHATPAEDDAVVHGSPRGSGAAAHAVAGGSDAVVTPAVVEQAIARTGQQYTADLRTILAELRAVYEGQIEAKDAALAAQAETIAELRRRAEAAEAERDRLAAAQAAQDGAGATPGASAADPSPAPAAGFWARVRRVFGASTG